MEPLEEQGVRVRWVIYTQAITVEDLGDDSLHSWWVRFDGSQEKLYFGKDKPFSAGDKVRVTFELIK